MENLDHVYCTNSSSSNNIIHNNEPDLLEKYRKEIKQLKSMLILYLDLIQEQSDQIVAKDKQLVKYKGENETLRLKLEKFINTFNKSSDYFIPSPTKNPPANDENRDKNGGTVNKIVLQRVQSSHNRNVIKIKKEPDQPNPTIISSMQFADYEERKEKTEEMANQTPQLEPEPLSPSNDIKLEVDDDEEEEDSTIICPPEHVVAEPIMPMVVTDEITRCKSPIKLMWQSSFDMPQQKLIVFNEIIQSEEKVEQNLNLQPQIDNANSNCSSSTHGGNVSDNSEEPSVNAKKAYRNSFIITSEPYITQNWKDEIINADIEKLYHNEAVELEVPCWKIIDDSNESPPEPSTENISDEAYMKRHSKLEIDERRRKKWDVQRIREQKTIERLKKRHLKEQYTDNEPKTITSFYPSSDMIKYIQITDEIPVQAFGESIPLLGKSYFYLPWHRPTMPMDTSPSTSCENQAAEVKTKFLHRLDPILQRQQKFTKRVAKKSD